MSLFRIVCFVIVACSLSLTPARAGDLEDARAAFNEAQVLFRQGQFGKAAEKFKVAYDAKPYPQFLFNVGAAYEKAKRYQLAVDYYEKYLAKATTGKDKVDILKRIAVLKGEIERINAGTDTGPSQAIRTLQEVKLQGVVVIRSTPPGATIYLDSVKNKPLGLTPWEGNLNGKHTIIVKLEGHVTASAPIKKIKSNRIRDIRFVLTRTEVKAENYLGLLRVTSNVPGAQVFLDQRETGEYGRTPFQKQINEGTHKLWVVAPGYKTFYKVIKVQRAKALTVRAELEGSPVGYLNFRGEGIDQARVLLDGKELCANGPCRVAVKQGAHKLEVAREGYKSYYKDFNVRPQTETRLMVDLQEEPSRVDAIVTWVVAGAVLGASIYTHVSLAPSLRDDARDKKHAVIPRQEAVDQCQSDPACSGSMMETQLLSDLDEAESSRDSAELKRDIALVSFKVGYGVAGGLAALALYYSLRDKGAPSSANVDTRALKVRPVVGLGYGGVGIGGTF